MNVWMLKCEDLTELGEMDFTLGVDEKSGKRWRQFPKIRILIM